MLKLDVTKGGAAGIIAHSAAGIGLIPLEDDVVECGGAALTVAHAPAAAFGFIAAEYQVDQRRAALHIEHAATVTACRCAAGMTGSDRKAVQYRTASRAAAGYHVRAVCSFNMLRTGHDAAFGRVIAVDISA